MITISQSQVPDLNLDEAPDKGVVLLLCNGKTLPIEYESIPQLIHTLQDFLKVS